MGPRSNPGLLLLGDIMTTIMGKTGERHKSKRGGRHGAAPTNDGHHSHGWSAWGRSLYGDVYLNAYQKRGKDHKAVREEAERVLKKALDKLEQAIEGDSLKGGELVQAVNVLGNRVHGSPKQSVEVRNHLPADQLTDDELASAIRSRRSE